MWRAFAARLRSGGCWHRAVRALRRIPAGMRWLSQSQRLANLIGLIALALALLPLLREDQPPGVDASTGSRRPAPTTVTGTPDVRTYRATIANTFSDEERRFTGVQSAVSPYVRGQADVGYLEGARVEIVCQVLDGRLVHDEVSGRTLSSTVWYRTADDVWIPAIYSDLPGAGPQTPPRC